MFDGSFESVLQFLNITVIIPKGNRVILKLSSKQDANWSQWETFLASASGSRVLIFGENKPEERPSLVESRCSCQPHVSLVARNKNPMWGHQVAADFLGIEMKNTLICN